MCTRVLVEGASEPLGATLRGLVDGEPDMRVIDLPQERRARVPDTPLLLPEVVVLDLGMQAGALRNGGSVSRVRALYPGAAVVVTSFFRDRRLAAAALTAGASAYLLIDHADGELVPAVRAAHHGRSYLGTGLND